MSSFVPAASLEKSTVANSELMSPAASALPWTSSRHQDGSVWLELLGVPGSGSCLFQRKATLKNAAGLAAWPAPPGCVASAWGWGMR